MLSLGPFYITVSLTTSNIVWDNCSGTLSNLLESLRLESIRHYFRSCHLDVSFNIVYFVHCVSCDLVVRIE